MKITGFSDLNICFPMSNFNASIGEHILSLGYKTVAINTTVGEKVKEKTKKKKNKPKDVIPVPVNPTNIESLEGKLRVLQRITTYFNDANQLQQFCKSENTKKYDIVSVIPSTTEAIQAACACKDVDLISFDPLDRPGMISRKMYNLAVSNGIYFEIPYAPAIADSAKRKNTIQTGHVYHAIGKSKNIVLTSGAVDISKLRSPYDIANLGILFGLSEEQAKSSMLNTARALILRAEGRRFGKTAMSLMITDLDLKSDEESEESDDGPAAKRSKKDNDSSDESMSE